jgi:hypothetical protein
MALGLEWDPLSITDNLLGEVTVTHVANDSNITGGFTLRLVAQPHRFPVACQSRRLGGCRGMEAGLRL